MVKGFVAVFMLVAVIFTVLVVTMWHPKISIMDNHSKDLEDQIIEDMKEDYVQGLTLLGGEPFLNTQVCLQLCKRVRKEFGHTKDIWSWSGYRWEELMKESYDKLKLLSMIDILVDGRFMEDKKDLTLQFRGSSNQRIINVPESLEQDKVVIWDKLVH